MNNQRLFFFLILFFGLFYDFLSDDRTEDGVGNRVKVGSDDKGKRRQAGFKPNPHSQGLTSWSITKTARSFMWPLPSILIISSLFVQYLKQKCQLFALSRFGMWGFAVISHFADQKSQGFNLLVRQKTQFEENCFYFAKRITPKFHQK